MALVQISFHSNVLQKGTNFIAAMPTDPQQWHLENNKHYDRPMKTLYLLHGYNGNEWDWMCNSKVMDVAMHYNMAVIMPAGDNHFYVNGEGTGSQYGEFTGRELVEFTRKTLHLSERREDTYVGGFSMGGFGGLHTALEYPENFSKGFGLSSAWIVNELKDKEPGYSNPVADYAYYRRVFGPFDKLKDNENNLEQLVLNYKKDGREIPGLFMACGTEDFLLMPNRAFRDFLIGEGVPVSYHEGPGSHDFGFWNEYLWKACEWLMEE